MWNAHGRSSRKGARCRVAVALWVALSLSVAGVVGSGYATPAFAAPVTVGGKAVVTNTGGDPIRIRQGAGTSFPQIGLAYQDQTISVLDGPRSDASGKQWFKVQAPGGTGWMSADFLQGVGAPATARLTGSAVVANTGGDPLRLRSDPSVNGNVLTLLSPGTMVAIRTGPLTDQTGIVWYGVNYASFAGWAMGQYLAQAPSSAPPPAAAPAQPVARNQNLSPPKPTALSQPTPQPKPTVQAKPATQAQPPAPAKPTAQPKPPATIKPAPQPKPAAPASSGLPTTAQYRQWMQDARNMYPYPQSVDKMWSVMMCESGGRANASGGGGRYLGLFQYAPATWAGGWNPYRGSSIWDAHSQIYATAKAWSLGMQSAWSCYYITPGR